jgi:hypothetical protein
MIFLIEYDTRLSRLLGVRDYETEQRDRAAADLESAQERYIDDSDHIEVALFEAGSRATLERTHSRYFKSLQQMSDDAAAARHS